MIQAPEVSTSDTKENSGSNQLLRSATNKKVAGVAGGLGEHFGVDPVWFRVAFVVLALGGGSGILIYLVMWLIVPERADGIPAPVPAQGNLAGTTVVGILFIVVGTIALVNTIAPGLGQYYWPAIFVVGGLALVMGGLVNDNR